MKNRINLTMKFFVPLLEIIYDENVRDALRFLQTRENSHKKFENLYFNKKNKQRNDTPHTEEIFVPHFGNLKIKLNSESYTYYRSTRAHICDKEPIRPLISFVSNNIKWKHKEMDKELKKLKKRVELYPFLTGAITKKAIYEFNNREDDFQGKIKKIIQICNNEKNLEKMNILSAVFSDYSNIRIKESNIHLIIETHSECFRSLNFDLKGKKKISINGLSIYVLDFNKILLITNEKHSNLFLERIKQTIALVFMLRILADRAIDVINKAVINDKNIRIKYEFFEFLLAVCNPIYYSSIENKKILPKHYQRILFIQIAELLAYKDYSDKIQELVIEKIKTWEPREQVMFLSRENTIINKIKSNYNLERNVIIEPIMTEKERILLDFLLNKYIEEVVTKGISGLQISTPRPIGSMSAFGIRTEIKKWLIQKGIEPNKISETELKVTPPRLIADLNRKDLVKIKKTEKGRTEYLYSINENDEYIQTRLRGVEIR